MSRRVILVFGQTGTLKEIAVNRIRDAVIANEHGLKPDEIDEATRNSLTQYLEVEREIKRLHKNDLLTYLKHQCPKTLHGDWTEAVRKVQSEMLPGDKTIFVGLHGHYSWQGRQFSPISLDLLKELAPTHSICLIDDLYCMYARIVNREDIRMEGCYFSLRELALTRATEIMISDVISQEIILPFDGYHQKNRVISVRQSPEDVYRLLFKPKMLKVYASFPISKTRFADETRSEIDAFRDAMKRDFMVFDPLTIDEKLLQFILIEYLWWKETPVELIAKKVKGGLDVERVGRLIKDNTERWKAHGKDYRCGIGAEGEEKVLLRQGERWHIPSERAMVDPSMGQHAVKFPIPLDPDEIEEVCYDIDKQIADRDFRLIHQADVISVYRPNFQREISNGVLREHIYATSEVEEKKDFVIFHKDQDGEPFAPFEVFSKVFSGNDMSSEINTVIDAMHVYETNLFQ